MRRTVSLLTSSRSVLAVLLGVVTLGVLAAGVGYASMNKTVTLSVDGETRKVEVFGDSVADVLASEGLELGDRDVVVPAADSEISEGATVSVRYARPLDVDVDGDETRYWVTATDVTSALDQLGLRFSTADLSASRGADIGRQGLDLSVVTAKKLSVRLGDERVRTRNVAALTVGQALRELGVQVDPLDRVRPGVGASIEDGDRIVLTNFRKVTRTDRQRIGFDSLEQSDGSMYVGQETLVREGRPGARRVVFRVTLRNGEPVNRAVVRTRVLRAPVDSLTRVGTAQRPEPEPAPAPEPEPAPEPAPAEAAPAPNYASGSTVWDSLAACESGGNWAINTGNGYYGGLQFSLPTWQAYGGPGIPSDQSRETQIAIAEKVVAATGGYGSWPSCSASLGLPQ